MASKDGSALEQVTQKQVPDHLRCELIKGADEIDLVNSGLEGTMQTAYREIRETLLADPRLGDLRTRRLRRRHQEAARAYEELGVFP